MTLPIYLQRRERTLRAMPSTGMVATPGSAPAYARAAFNAELAELAAQTQPGRNDRLNIAAFNLSQLVAAGHLDHLEVWNALHSTGLAIGLEAGEVANTLRSAFGAGLEQPREVELAPDQSAPEVTVLERPHGTEEAADQEEEALDPVAAAVARFNLLDWHELWARDDEEEWVLEPVIPARRLVALYSPPKTGKSLLMLELAVAIATGGTALGRKLDRPRRVLYVDFENDPRGDVRVRLQALGYGPDDLERLHYASYPQIAYLDTFTGGAELLAVALELGVDVVVIDTVSRAVAGEENDNDTWLAFYRHTGQQLKAAGIAAVRLDHTGKDLAKGMRGGSAKYGDVDAVWSLTALSETTLRLECTANRLPIPEKVLTLRRESGPPLRHTVELGGAALRADLERAARIVESLGVDEPSVRKIKAAFTEAGLHPKGNDPTKYSASFIQKLANHMRDRVSTLPAPDPDLGIPL